MSFLARTASTLAVLALLAARVAASGVAEEGWVVHSVALSPSGSVSAIARMHAEKGTSKLVIERRGDSRSEIDAPGPIRDMTFFSGDERLATAHDDGTIRLFRVSDGQLAGTLSKHDGWVLSVAASPDGTRVASGGRDGKLVLWDTASLEAAGRSETGSPVAAAAFSRDGSKLAYASGDDGVRVIDAAPSGNPRAAPLEGSAGPVVSLGFSPDGRRLAAGRRDGEISLWDAIGPGGPPPRRLVGHEKTVSAVRFSPDGRRLASASWDGCVRIWDVETSRCVRVHGGDRPLGDLVFTVEGTVIALDFDGKRRVHDANGAR